MQRTPSAPLMRKPLGVLIWARAEEKEVPVMRGLAWIISVLLILVPIAASSAAESAVLVGKWRELNGKDVIEFKKDGHFAGTMAYGMDRMQRAVSGTYFVVKKKISIKLNDSSPMTWEYEFTDGKLIITYQQGGEVKEDGSMAQFRRSP
jgi:uncharacterized protein (DUF2147 family)